VTQVQCLLWDFGDTLCNELSLWRGSAEWMEVYRSFDEPDGLGGAWAIGDLDTHQLAVKLAERMTLSESDIRAHLSRSDVFEFFPFTYDFFRERHLPQAIVTVNPAQFRVLAGDLAFDRVTDTIVISGEERNVDKSALCEIALRRMPNSYPHSRALLIDNKRANIDAWVRRGGIGYHYTTDAAFRRDVAAGIDGLVRD
jgi:hypothetical protein